MKITNIFLLLAIVPSLALPLLSNGQTPPIETKEDIEAVLNTVVTWLYGIVGTIAVLMLIIGGIMYMTAGGDEDKIAKAKGMVKFAIIGLVIALIAWGVKTIILSFMP